MYIRPAPLDAHRVVYCGNGYACYARLMRYRVPKDAGRVHRRVLAFDGGPGGYALIQRFLKINISLTIESIAK